MKKIKEHWEGEKIEWKKPAKPAKVTGRPLKGDRPKSEKVSIRIESKEKSLLIKKYGSISAGIDHLLKRFLKEQEQ